MSKRRKKRSYAGSIVFVLFIVILAIAIFMFLFNKDKLMKNVEKKVTTLAIEQMINTQTSGKNIDIDEMKKKMDEKDVDNLNTMIEKYADSDKMKECIEIYKNNGTSAAKEYIKEQINKEDIEKLKELYQKYKDEIK